MYYVDSESADSSEDEHAIIDNLSDLDRRCDEIGLGETTILDPTPQNVEMNATKETFDRILDKLTEVIGAHRARDQDGAEERSFRDGTPDLENESPVSIEPSNPGASQLVDQITEVPPRDQTSIGRHLRASTPAMKVTYLQDQSTQATVKQGSKARSVAVQSEQNSSSPSEKKQGTDAPVPLSDTSALQDTLATIQHKEVKPCQFSQSVSPKVGGG